MIRLDAIIEVLLIVAAVYVGYPAIRDGQVAVTFVAAALAVYAATGLRDSLRD